MITICDDSPVFCVSEALAEFRRGESEGGGVRSISTCSVYLVGEFVCESEVLANMSHYVEICFAHLRSS